MERVKIGKRLKELRTKTGITQKVIADYLNIRVNSYSQYENDVRQPDYNTLQRIAEYYNVSVDYIFDFEKTHKFMDVDLLYGEYRRAFTMIFNIFKEKKFNVDEDDVLRKIKKLEEIKSKLLVALVDDEFENQKKIYLKRI